MKWFSPYIIRTFIAGFSLSLSLNASTQSIASTYTLFETDDILNITVTGNLTQLLNDRISKPKLHPFKLSYFRGDSGLVEINVDIKTRGHFRRLKENCFYPPLLIEFSKDSAYKSTIFNEQNKLKLVMPCKEHDEVIKEWLVYKIYNLLTPVSFKTKLVKVNLVNHKNKLIAPPFFGILLEEEKQMAKRSRSVSVERKVRPEEIQTEAFTTMAVFEYLIGNTDWSVQYQHNIKILASDSLPGLQAVPYDFDHAGIVNASYAKPADELLMNSVRQRRYRGYCTNNVKIFEPVIEKFNVLKKDIYSLYTHCKFLNEKNIKSTLTYLDEFYQTISSPSLWVKEFTFPCYNKTGNVIIKGLKD